jgi:GPH family glycoside/pentoside/hexuronide:cation symporter
MTQHASASQSPVRSTSPFRYAVGMFGTSNPINMFKTYAAIFYVDRLGLSTAHYALVLLIYTFVDAIDNPVYGFLSDRTRSRWGRRRPWLVIGTPLLVLCFILFFFPPALSPTAGLFVYMLLMYILTGTLDSLINANYGALFPELFPNDAIRAKTNAMRQGFQLLAMVISIALTPMVTEKLGYSTPAIVYGALALVVILFMAFGSHEQPQSLEMAKHKLWDSLKVILTNPKFYVKYSLSLDAGKTTLLLGSVLLLAGASMAVWAWLIKRFHLMRIWRLALLLLGLAFIPLYFMNGLVGAIAGSSVVGLGMAGVMASMDLIGARIMDEDTRKHNLRREGIYSSAMGFMNRLSGLFVSLAFLLVNRFYGFVSGDAPGLNPGGAARFLMVIFPVAAMVLSCVFSLFMRFPEDTSGTGDAPGASRGPEPDGSSETEVQP